MLPGYESVFDSLYNLPGQSVEPAPIDAPSMGEPAPVAPDAAPVAPDVAMGEVDASTAAPVVDQSNADNNKGVNTAAPVEGGANVQEQLQRGWDRVKLGAANLRNRLVGAPAATRGWLERQRAAYRAWVAGQQASGAQVSASEAGFQQWLQALGAPQRASGPAVYRGSATGANVTELAKDTRVWIVVAVLVALAALLYLQRNRIAGLLPKKEAPAVAASVGRRHKFRRTRRL